MIDIDRRSASSLTLPRGTGTGDKTLRTVLVALLVVTAAVAAVAAPVSRPATTSMPATPRATSRPPSRAVIEPAATPLLANVAAAYAVGRPLRITGRLDGTFDVAGRRRTYHLPVEGTTDGRGQFCHDAGLAGWIVVGDRGGYLYDARRDAFAELPAADGRLSADDVSDALVDVLLDENPALLLTLSDDPAGLLARAATRIAVAGVAGRPATRPALRPTSGLTLTRTNKAVTLWLTDAGLVTAATIDYRPLMRSRGAAGVKAAVVELTYDEPTSDPPSADIFTRRPPASATEFGLGEDLQRPTSRPRP